MDIGMPTLEKQRAIARRLPAIGMPSGITDDIRLGLDDTAAGDAFSHLPHQYLPMRWRAREAVSVGSSARASGRWTSLRPPDFRASARPIALAKAPARMHHRNTGSRGPPSRRGTP